MSTKKKLIPVQVIPAEKVDGSFIKQELPIVIEGGAKSWPAFQKWTVDFFKSNYGSVEVPLSNYRKNPYQDAASKQSTRVDEYLDSALRISAGQADEREDLYSAGWFFCRGYCELLQDVAVPAYFADNWADKVQKVIHFDTKSILFGHPKVESPLHTDSFFVSTYFAMIKGQKRMRLVAPEHTQHVHNGYNVYDDEKVAELEHKGVPVYDCVIKEGDIVWFPPGWWHHVKNDTFTISITTNFVDAYHFLPFEQQVRATILKPLLNLAKVKEECLEITGVNQSLKAIDDSKFDQLERRYVAHFQRELSKTSAMLDSIESTRTQSAGVA